MRPILQLLVIIPIVLLASASSCDQDTVAGTNNLDRPSDLLVLKSADQSHSYLVTTNPRAKALRFFDITEGLFVAAPNLAFPLATVVGPGSHQLAKSHNNDRLFFVLDTALEEVFTITTIANGDQPAFTHARAPFRTPKAVQDIAVFQDGTDAPWVLWLTANTPAQIVQYQISPQAPYDVSGGAVLSLDAPATDLQFTHNGDWAFLAKHSATSNLEVISGADNTTVANTTLPFIPRELVIRPNTTLGNLFYEIWLRSQGGDRIGLAIFDQTSKALRFLGSSETSAPVTALFAPTLQEGDETVLATCCSGVSDDRKNAQWLTTVDTEGDLLYWHEQLSGNDFESLKLTLLPFNNAETSLSVSLTCRDSAEETKTSCGTATLTSLSDSVALWDQWRFEHDIIATWEGAPNGLSRRAVSFDIDQNSFTPQYGLFPLDTGLTAGARVTVTYDEVDTTCTGSHSATLETLAEASLTVSGLSTTINSCLSATGVQISVHPNDGFSVKDTQHGNLGNVYANSSGEFSLTLGHWQTKLTLEAQNEWEQGDTVVISISNPISPVGLFLSQNFSYQSGGFGTYGNYPAAISGGEVKMRTTDNDIAAVRQLYVVTETGSLFEFGEAETDLANVISYK